MNINVHIERLILDGFPVPSDQGGLVRAAVEAELVRLLSIGSFAMTSSRAVRRITASPMQVKPDTTARQLGQQLGRTVYASLNKSGRADKVSRSDVPQFVSTQSAAPLRHGLEQPSRLPGHFSDSG